MGGAMTKHINQKITDICISTITKVTQKHQIISGSDIILDLKGKYTNISNNVFKNNIKINISTFLSTLKNSNIENEILNNIKNNSELIDEGFVSFLSKNDSEVVNSFTNAIKKRIETITGASFKNDLKNKIEITIESDVIIFDGNTLNNSLDVLAQAIIGAKEIVETQSKLSTEMANTSKITIKNAAAIFFESLSGFLTTPLLVFLAIIITLAIILLTFKNTISSILFGWIPKKK